MCNNYKKVIKIWISLLILHKKLSTMKLWNNLGINKKYISKKYGSKWQKLGYLA